MSFLKEVLSSSEEADIQMLNQKLPLISTQISSCKQEVLKFIDDVYYKFSEWPRKNQKLLDLSSHLSNELNHLQQKIEHVTIKEIEKNNTDITNLSKELDRSNAKLLFVTHIIQIHETFLSVRKLQEDKSFVKAAYEFIDLEELIDIIPENEANETINILKCSLKLEKTSILYALHEMFNEIIQVNCKVANNIQTYTIKIAKKVENVSELFEVLNLFKAYDATLDRVCKFVLEVCTGVIHNVTTIKLQDEGLYHIIVIAIKKTVVKCQYHEVFSKLIDIFAFLYSYFDCSIGNGLTTMRYFGDVSGRKFAKTLIDDCLDKTKPSNDSQYTTYDAILKGIMDFQEKLVEFNIFQNENELLAYAKNMDEVLIEQKCSKYLADAISLMKKDLHDSLEVGVKNEDGDFLTPEQFPRSIISRSVLDILNLVQKLLDEALVESEQYAARLICTAQSIFYQYGNIVHGHHERLLQTIPQQVTLFRNNCLYIAHSLVQINIEYSPRFSQAALPSPPLFPDQGHQLQTMGGEIFLGYIDDQVRQMEMMLDTHLTPAHVADKLDPDIEKIIRQCLRQYELLRTVWVKILPQSVYNKSIGYLFNAFCKKLIATVLNAQDISLPNAEQLLEVFKVIIARGPKLFTSVEEVGLYVESWAKLNDLGSILGSNLVGINDMWSDGKGVLTLTFTAEEVRSLIKALFQNTDRRAAVLSKIH